MTSSATPAWKAAALADSDRAALISQASAVSMIFLAPSSAAVSAAENRRANNGPRKGNDRFMQMRIDFMDAIFGKTETINIDVDEQCKECGGSGAYSSSDIQHLLAMQRHRLCDDAVEDDVRRRAAAKRMSGVRRDR